MQPPQIIKGRCNGESAFNATVALFHQNPYNLANRAHAHCKSIISGCTSPKKTRLSLLSFDVSNLSHLLPYGVRRKDLGLRGPFTVQGFEGWPAYGFDNRPRIVELGMGRDGPTSSQYPHARAQGASRAIFESQKKVDL